MQCDGACTTEEVPCASAIAGCDRDDGDRDDDDEDDGHRDDGESVTCPGMTEYCNCGDDCTDPEGSAWCQCDAAQACCSGGPAPGPKPKRQAAFVVKAAPRR